MSKPIRVRRRRTKGWKMPPNTMYVGRGTMWGNPFMSIEKINPYNKKHQITIRLRAVTDTAEEAVGRYIHEVITDSYSELAREKLKGKNLTCFCKLGEACHADILLEIANHE